MGGGSLLRRCLLRWNWRVGCLALPVASLLLFSLDARALSDVSEYALKAAFIYNFAKFIEWPAQTDGVLHLCVVGDDLFDGELEKLQGKSVGALRVNVERPMSQQQSSACQIVFVPETQSKNLSHIVRTVKDSGVLTIGDFKGCLDRGVMIEMLLEEGRISFEVNIAAARRGNLTISSKLLRLARRVY